MIFFYDLFSQILCVKKALSKQLSFILMHRLYVTCEKSANWLKLNLFPKLVRSISILL
jgi:hypothetical protein